MFSYRRFLLSKYISSSLFYNRNVIVLSNDASFCNSNTAFHWNFLPFKSSYCSLHAHAWPSATACSATAWPSTSCSTSGLTYNLLLLHRSSCSLSDVCFNVSTFRRISAIIIVVCTFSSFYRRAEKQKYDVWGTYDFLSEPQKNHVHIWHFICLIS